jgi:hypothetical protein
MISLAAAMGKLSDSVLQRLEDRFRILVLVPLVFVLPAVVLITSCFAASIRKKTLIEAAFDAWKVSWIPLTCIAALLFAGTTKLTASLEAAGSRDLRAMVRHEGEYLARITHNTWPK